MVYSGDSYESLIYEMVGFASTQLKAEQRMLGRPITFATFRKANNGKGK